LVSWTKKGRTGHSVQGAGTGRKRNQNPSGRRKGAKRRRREPRKKKLKPVYNYVLSTELWQEGGKHGASDDERKVQMNPTFEAPGLKEKRSLNNAAVGVTADFKR